MSAFGEPEVEAVVDDPRHVNGCRALVRWLADSLVASTQQLKSEEVIAYGSWLIKLTPAAPGLLMAAEFDAQTASFIPGVSSAVECWEVQHQLCERLGARFAPSRLDQLVVISDGVLNSKEPVQGVRYPSPAHMSGWWITSNRYNGDTASLQTTHTYHVVAARPGLAPYLALPYGFRFDFAVAEDVWFDDDVANSPPE